MYRETRRKNEREKKPLHNQPGPCVPTTSYPVPKPREREKEKVKKRESNSSSIPMCKKGGKKAWRHQKTQACDIIRKRKRDEGRARESKQTSIRQGKITVPTTAAAAVRMEEPRIPF